MTSTPNRLLWAVLFSGLVVMWSIHDIAAQGSKPVTVTRLYTGADGQTHAAETAVKLVPSATAAGEARSNMFKASGAQFVRWAPGHVQDWHPPSNRQYAIVLSGRGEIELGGGQKIRVGPGGVILAEDLKGKGHITRAVGKEELVFLLVPLAGE